MADTTTRIEKPAISAANDKRFLIVPPKFQVDLGVDKVTEYTREQALTLIWRHTHRDFKSTEGARSILQNVSGKGTCLVHLETMTDEQIEAELPFCHKQELQRLAKKAAKPKVASREEQHARYIDAGPGAWDDR